MKTYNVLICATAFVVGAVFSASAGEGDSCAMYKQTRDARLRYEVSVGRQRVDLEKQAAGIKSEIMSDENKILDTKEKIISATETEKENLWKECDALGLHKDSLFTAYDKVRSEIGKINSERQIKRFEMKNKAVSELYECVVNKRLNEKLDQISKKVKNDASIPETERKILVQLIESRRGLVDGIAKDYQVAVPGIEDQIKKIKENQTRIIAKEEDVAREQKENDKIYDAIYESMDSLSNKLFESREKLMAMSKQIMDKFETLGKK